MFLAENFPSSLNEAREIGLGCEPQYLVWRAHSLPVSAQQRAPILKSQQAEAIAKHDDLIEPGGYFYTDGNAVHRPAQTASGAAPTGAYFHCRDGTYSFSQSPLGT